ncbi:MAG: hypothetical protein E6G36_01330 [Actinobacteria bacterium]|nr:MAG: hypothetical protein E6G36_01330 [Actinomycetota bacterium]
MRRFLTGSLIPVEQGGIELIQAEQLWQDDDAADHGGNGCTFVADFMTAAHLILVWEQRDDPNLLHHAQRAKEVGRNPRIEAYASQYGPSASYYAWEAAGGPVHGVRAR